MPMGCDHAAQQRKFPFEEGLQRLTIVIKAYETDPEDTGFDEGVSLRRMFSWRKTPRRMRGKNPKDHNC